MNGEVVISANEHRGKAAITLRLTEHSTWHQYEYLIPTELSVVGTGPLEKTTQLAFKEVAEGNNENTAI